MKIALIYLRLLPVLLLRAFLMQLRVTLIGGVLVVLMMPPVWAFLLWASGNALSALSVFLLWALFMVHYRHRMEHYASIRSWDKH